MVTPRMWFYHSGSSLWWIWCRRRRSFTRKLHEIIRNLRVRWPVPGRQCNDRGHHQPWSTYAPQLVNWHSSTISPSSQQYQEWPTVIHCIIWVSSIGMIHRWGRNCLSWVVGCPQGLNPPGDLSTCPQCVDLDIGEHPHQQLRRWLICLAHPLGSSGRLLILLEAFVDLHHIQRDRAIMGYHCVYFWLPCPCISCCLTWSTFS